MVRRGGGSEVENRLELPPDWGFRRHGKAAIAHQTGKNSRRQESA
jgi:hypothetical protein